MWHNNKKFQAEFVEGIKEVNADEYEEMLRVLPPEAMAGGAFLVGEPTDHNGAGVPRYALYFERANKYFYGGLATINDFRMMLIPTTNEK